MGEDFGFALSATSSDIVVATEELLFPITSLVAEFGGTLGLFLGFSFMALWDEAEILIKGIRKIIKKATR
jgi:hypothetical protein